MAYHSKTSLSLVFEGAKFDMKISIAEHAAVAPGVTFATSSRCSQTTRHLERPNQYQTLRATPTNNARNDVERPRDVSGNGANSQFPQDQKVHACIGIGAWGEGRVGVKAMHAYPLTIGENALLRRPCLFRTSREGSAEGAYLTKVRRPTCSAPASSSPGSPARVVG